MLISSAQQQQLSAQIAHWEKNTAAEFVIVVARKSDAYSHTPILTGAMLALITPPLLSLAPWWLSHGQLLLAQWLVFFIASAVCYLPWLHRHVTPRALKQRRARELARTQFIEQNLHHTRHASGVLIFISEFEHYVEILADKGINDKVPPDYWETLLKPLLSEMSRGKTAAGLLKTIDSLGGCLSEHFPADNLDNELPNNVILL